MPAVNLLNTLRTIEACNDSIAWMGSLPPDTTPETAWTICPRGDWLIWLLGRLHVRGLISRQTLVLASCASARTALRHLAGTPWETACCEAINVAEQWCHGEATLDDVRAATRAVWQARRADAADADAAYAAYAAAYAAYAYAAADADAAYAAYAAAYAAAAAAYAYDAADAAAAAAYSAAAAYAAYNWPTAAG
jgi:hypothetical protein